VPLKPNICRVFSGHIQIVNTKNNTKYSWGYPKIQGRGPLKPAADTSDTADTHQKLNLKKEEDCVCR
jgi:hypothetical protein